MKLYDHVIPAEFLARPNRFIARVSINGRDETVHVKNTGRCRELLLPGARVWLAEGANPARKTRYDLVAVEKGSLLINMDSQAPNKAAAEALPRLFPDIIGLRPEAAFGDSRLDFCADLSDRKLYVEVKGCTLEENGVALFPDAPTERGVRHLHELENCVRAGHAAALLIVIQMQGVRVFRPNRRTHPAFADALRHARDAGVQVIARDCIVTPESLTINQAVKVELE